MRHGKVSALRFEKREQLLSEFFTIRRMCCIEEGIHPCHCSFSIYKETVITLGIVNYTAETILQAQFVLFTIGTRYLLNTKAPS